MHFEICWYLQVLPRWPGCHQNLNENYSFDKRHKFTPRTTFL